MSSDDADELQSAQRGEGPSEAPGSPADYNKSPSEASKATARLERSPSEESRAAADHERPSDPERRPGQVVVAIPALPASQIGEYQEVHSDAVERIVEEVTKVDGRDLFYQVEFRDGRHDMVSIVTSWIRLEYGTDLPTNRFRSMSSSD